MVDVPDVPVFILSSPDGCQRLEKRVARWAGVELVPIERGDVRATLRFLRARRRMDRVSAVGGRSSASALLDAGLVQDMCLTTAE
jgi:riboflavin biosynthesis pyrimidine reductase